MPQVELANLSNLDIPLSALLYIRVYEQTFENGTTDLTANNCTQNVQNAEVYGGQYALEVTVSAGQTGYVETPTRPVSPSQLVTFRFAHKENEYVESIKLAVVWRSASGREISVDEFSLTPSTSWQLDSRTVSAPKHAVSMAIRVIITAKSDGDAVVYLDDITMDLIGFTVRVDGEGNIKINIAVDDVGLAKEETQLSILAKVEALTKALQSINQDKVLTVPSNPPNLDVKLSDVKSAIQSILSRYARLQIYDTSSSTWKDVKDMLPVSINRDNVGLLKEGGTVNVGNFPSDYPDSGTHTRLDDIDMKLSDIESTLSKLTKALQSVGTDKILVKPDNPPNLDIKLSALDNDIKSELTRIAKLRGYDYVNGVWRDIAVDESGRLLCTLK